MDHESPANRQRLALLLAGAGSRCRRALAAMGQQHFHDRPGHDLLASLAASTDLVSVQKTARKARGIEGARTTQVLERAATLGWRWSTPGDEDYPAILEHHSDPPLGLFMRGRLGTAPCVAIVGSRNATQYGLDAAGLIAEQLGRSGATIVSGMARGIDTAAHQGALAAGSTTAAVWGTGPDTVYPAENRGLAEAIAAQGALLTEYPPGVGVRKHHFPQRNRLVAGLASAVIIVEAAARSGALITARLALDEGREVFAVPGSIFSKLSIGPNALLRMGARPLVTPKDVIDELDLSGAGQPAPGLADTQQSEQESEDGVLRFLPRGEPANADDLAERCGLPVDQVLSSLLALELEGSVTRREDGYYIRRR